MGCVNTKSRSQQSSRSSFDSEPKNVKYLPFSNQYKNGIPQLQNISVSTILQRRKKHGNNSV
ncbi:unnamed protein product [Paramecium primaurelia]|uniref:Uncharacterized protein n=1 Tax=Paramecium primaurelia TaxID=5886 RepID=A0A8S1JV68_PARPR|nr:unnamed protein product [Paramecium primaurelia]